MTQFEKIKAMSIDELAEAIYKGIDSTLCDYCPEIDNYTCYVNYCDSKCGKEIIAEWLESEAE